VIVHHLYVSHHNTYLNVDLNIHYVLCINNLPTRKIPSQLDLCGCNCVVSYLVEIVYLIDFKHFDA